MRPYGVSILITLVCLAALVSSSHADDSLDDIVEKLVILASPSYSERETTKKRFVYMLPRIVEDCSDVKNVGAVGNVVASMHKIIGGSGVEEEWLPLTNTMYRIANEVQAVAGYKIKCIELWSMYAVLRQEGQSSEDARGAVTQLASTLYGL